VLTAFDGQGYIGLLVLRIALVSGKSISVNVNAFRHENSLEKMICVPRISIPKSGVP
jgi:hypothetical protein